MRIDARRPVMRMDAFGVTRSLGKLNPVLAVDLYPYTNQKAGNEMKMVWQLSVIFEPILI